MNQVLLARVLRILLFLFLVFGGLYYARGFLIPLAFATLLSMLLLPISRKLESRGIHRGIAVLICILGLLAIFAGLGALLYWQVSDLVDDASQVEQRIRQMLNQLEQSVRDTLGISRVKAEEILKEQQSSGNNLVLGIVAGVPALLAKFVLVLVYMFLLMYFRTHLKNFILKLVPEQKKRKTVNVVEDCRNVAQQYIGGLAMMIFCLWVMYSIGFSIVGVKNSIFFAVLCGILEIVPFVGNLTGTLITIIMVLVQGGDSSMVLGVVITYATVQFLQTYLLEPLVVGAEVHINPLSTIMVIVIGEMLWGIAGMILAIPLLGITKILMDNIEPLKPYGFLIGEGRKKKTGIGQKLKGMMRKK